VSKQLRQTAKISSQNQYLERILPEQLNPELVRKLPLEFLKAQCAIPVSLEDGRVAVAMADVLNVEAYDAIVSVLARPCERLVCPASEIEQAISRCYYQNELPGTKHDKDGLPHTVSQTEFTDTSSFTNTVRNRSLPDNTGAGVEALPDGRGDIDTSFVQTRAEDLLNIANKAPVIKLVNKIFFDAVHSRASDIHVEPYEEAVRIRFRVDGVLHDVFSLPGQQAAALLSRLKIMSNLDISERRLPQDGQSRIKIGGSLMDIRVSIIPTLGGERAVLRLLDKANGRLDLDHIGLCDDLLEPFRNLVGASHGIILLTGPTGSGKTTTLYAVINELNCEEQNILTVEDPIEYQLAGVGQMQVKPRIGLTFASCLRHILRQDPNVIMVGEIRDLETAQIAIQASLTGHLVLSTLHTNDSVSAITRLTDMGIEPYLISSSVIAVMAQRLVRIICPHCKGPYTPDDELAFLCSEDEQTCMAKSTLYRGQGCKECLQTGYIGRTGIFELLVLDDEIKELVNQRCSCHTIKKLAVKKGMQTLRGDGLDKVLAGETTLAELCRVTQQHRQVNKQETELVRS